MAELINTQRICTATPFCHCAGGPNKWDECCCTGNIPGCSASRCENCGAALVLINIETGEEAAA